MFDPDLRQQQPGNSDMIVTVRSDSQVLQLPLNADISLRQALDATELRVRAACGGLGTCGACLIQIVSGSFNPPTPTERQKIQPDELANGMRFACQLRARSDGELYLQHPAPHSEWKSLDASQLYRAAGNAAITEHVYGVAVDLGTTHIRLSLWNRQSGRRIGSRYSINPQVACGADVLTRLDADRLADPDSRVLISNSHYAHNLADFWFRWANNSTFRRIRPAFQHEIEQLFPAIKAEVCRKRLHIIEQTPARR